MAALTRNYDRHRKIGERRLGIAPALADAVYYHGALVALDAQGRAVNATDAAGIETLGVLVETAFPDDPERTRNAHLDNTGGEDGVVDTSTKARFVRFDRTGVWAFDVTGAPQTGATVHVVDNNTLSTAAGANAVVVGRILEPHNNGQWFVDFDWS